MVPSLRGLRAERDRGAPSALGELFENLSMAVAREREPREAINGGKPEHEARARASLPEMLDDRRVDAAGLRALWKLRHLEHHTRDEHAEARRGLGDEHGGGEEQALLSRTGRDLVFVRHVRDHGAH